MHGQPSLASQAECLPKSACAAVNDTDKKKETKVLLCSLKPCCPWFFQSRLFMSVQLILSSVLESLNGMSFYSLGSLPLNNLLACLQTCAKGSLLIQGCEQLIKNIISYSIKWSQFHSFFYLFIACSSTHFPNIDKTKVFTDTKATDMHSNHRHA